MKAEFIYNKDLDSIAVFNGRKTYASIELGKEIIIALDRHNRVTGVEIFNPDKLFKIPKKLLNDISMASLTSTVRGGLLCIYVFLKIHDIEKEIPILAQIR